MPRALRRRAWTEGGSRAVDQNLAFVAAVRVHAGEQLDQRGFAGAVLAAQRVHFAGAQVEADARERGDAAEALDDVARLEDEVGRHDGGGRCEGAASLMRRLREQGLARDSWSRRALGVGHAAIDLVVCRESVVDDGVDRCCRG